MYWWPTATRLVTPIRGIKFAGGQNGTPAYHRLGLRRLEGPNPNIHLLLRIQILAQSRQTTCPGIPPGDRPGHHSSTGLL